MQDRKGLVSFIVPCYNIEKYLPRCLDSLLGQTYKNIEVLVADDGSIDGTASICKEYAKKDSRVKIFHTPHRGISYTRNLCLDSVSGAYIACVDGDDFVSEHMAEDMLAAMRLWNADIVACNYMLYFGKGKCKAGNTDMRKDHTMSAQDAVQNLFQSEARFCTAWAKLYKKEVWDGLRYPEKVFFGEDMMLAPKLFSRCKTIGYLAKPYYYYSQEGGSLVRSSFNRQKLNMVAACRGWVDLCEQQYPAIRDAAKKCYFETLINMCSPLAAEKKFHAYYNEYRNIIKANKKEIQRLPLRKNDKHKARLICYFSAEAYHVFRRVFLQIESKVKDL